MSKPVREFRIGHSVTTSNYPLILVYEFNKDAHPGYINYNGSIREIKTHDVTVTAVSIATLLAIRRGTSPTQRVGDQIRVLGVEVSNSGDSMILVVDKQANGALPTASDLYINAGSGPWRNMDNIRRFDFLTPVQIMPRTENLADSAAGETIASAAFYISLDIPIRYQSDNGDVTDVSENNILTYKYAADGTQQYRFYFVDV